MVCVKDSEVCRLSLPHQSLSCFFFATTVRESAAGAVQRDSVGSHAGDDSHAESKTRLRIVIKDLMINMFTTRVQTVFIPQRKLSVVRRHALSLEEGSLLTRLEDRHSVFKSTSRTYEGYAVYSTRARIKMNDYYGYQEITSTIDATANCSSSEKARALP